MAVWQIRYDLLEPRPESRMCYNIQPYIFHLALLNRQKVGWNRHNDMYIYTYMLIDLLQRKRFIWHTDNRAVLGISMEDSAIIKCMLATLCG